MCSLPSPNQQCGSHPFGFHDVNLWVLLMGKGQSRDRLLRKGYEGPDLCPCLWRARALLSNRPRTEFCFGHLLAG